MAAVYRAIHHPTRNEVALKLLSIDQNLTPERKTRFFREAHLAAQLDHPNIIKIQDVGEAQQHLFLAMELLQGQDLKAVQASTIQPDLPQKLRWMKELALTFSFAHSRGIVHRDIKPSNVWVREDQTIVVMDFGIARPLTSDITRAGIILGTPDYISPEQILSIRVDQRTDIFLLGLLFYELLTETHPFAGDTQARTAHNLLNETPLHPCSLQPSIPESIGEMILKCLSKDMNQRYDSCADISEILNSYEL